MFASLFSSPQQYQPHVLARVFPPPRYMRMPAAGVDISDDTIKHVALSHRGAKIELGPYGTLAMPEGGVSGGTILKPNALVDVLTQLAERLDDRFVHASLPEEHAYLFETEVGADVDARQLETVLEFKLKENIPLSPGEALFDYALFPATQEQQKRAMRSVVVAVYPRNIVESYLTVFQKAGLTPLSFEIEGQANARSIMPVDDPSTVMIVDVGKLGSEVSIVSHGMVVYTAMLDVCGDSFTKAIQNTLGVSYEEAQRRKHTQGFVKDRDDPMQFDALVGPMSALRDEINKHLVYRQFRGEKDTAIGKVAKIVLCGGNANLKGLVQYLNVTMNLPVEQANVWTNILTLEETIPDITFSESLRYATALGLALRSIARST